MTPKIGKPFALLCPGHSMAELSVHANAMRKKKRDVAIVEPRPLLLWGARARLIPECTNCQHAKVFTK